MKTRVAFFSLVFIVLTIIVGCQASQPDQLISTDTSRGPAITPTLLGSVTATIRSTPTVFTLNAPSITPQPSSTEKAENDISRLFDQLTQTPIPTLPADRKQAVIMELLTTNGGCQLPCWWGITPGVTTWEEAQTLLAPLVDEMYSGNANYLLEERLTVPTTGVTTIFSIDGYSDQLLIHFYITNEIITAIYVMSSGTDIFFSVNRLLTELEQPEEVLLDLIPETPIGKPWFNIWLYYPKKGVLAILFDGVGENVSEDLIEICPTELSPRLILTTPNRYTLREMIRYSYDLPGIILRSIEDVSDLSLAEFTEVMSESGGCMLVRDSGEHTIPFPAPITPTLTTHPIETTLAQPASTVQPARTQVPENVIPTVLGRLTQTPIPTLPADRKQAVIMELLTTKGGCQLPCWWGITPGVTTWEEAQTLLAPLVFNLRSGNVDYPLEGLFDNPIFAVEATLSIDSYSDDLLIRFYITNGIITDIYLVSSGADIFYSLNQLLSESGQPEEVLLLLETKTSTGKPWFGIWLYYPMKGVLAIIGGVGEYISENLIEICPTKISPRLLLTAPDRHTLQDMIRYSYHVPGVILPSIEEVSELSLAEFTKVMSEPGGCMLVKDTGEYWR